MILQKLLVYFLCIAVIAFVYVYKVPIFCSECEKPSGFAKNIFRCVVDEDKLCSVSHELNNVKDYATDFVGWLGNIVVNEIPNSILNEIKKIFELLKPIKEALNGLLDKVKKIFEFIKKEYIDKVTKVFTDLSENVSTMFTEIKDGTKNMAYLIYQSIDNIKTNALNKINDAITDIQNKIKTTIIDPIMSLVAKMGEVFSKIKDFFDGLASKIIKPFTDFYNMLTNACIPEITILPDDIQIFPRIDIDVVNIHLNALNIPKIKIPKFCPFDSLASAFKTITDSIQTAFNNLLAPITQPFKDLGIMISAFGKTINDGIDTVKKFFWEKYNTVSKYITDAFEPIQTFFINIGDKISSAYTDSKNFIIKKLTDLKDAIIKFFIESFNKLYDEIDKLFKPVFVLVQKAWDSFKDVFKNFIASLNELYILVKEKWNIVYKFVYDRIFYVMYIAYINAVNYLFPISYFLPISKTLKVNIFNGVVIIGLMGVMNYYYNFFNKIIYNITNSILVGVGDLYGLISMVSTITDPFISIIYNMLTIVPTLKFAMDALSSLSPTKIIPKIVNIILYITEFSVGLVQDTFMLFPTTTAFITILLLTVFYVIHRYLNSNLIKKSKLKIEKLPPLPEKPKLKSTDTTEIEKLQKEINDKSTKDPIIDKVPTQMDGVMGEFQTKMDNFKKRVDLIEEVRKGYAYDPNNPKKELEMNIDNMIKKLNQQIALKGL